MAISAAWMGVVLFLQKRSLVSETLSHAAYPGAVVGLLMAPSDPVWAVVFVVAGALVSASLASGGMCLMQKKIKADASLSFTLSVSFGLGLLIYSAIQGSLPSSGQRLMHLLFGQAATMGDSYLAFYGALTVLLLAVGSLLFRTMQAIVFHRDFSFSIGLPVKTFDALLQLLLLVVLALGFRSVGVLLMSGMLIAPAIAARQYTDRFGAMFLYASLFGALSAAIGVYISVYAKVPTGPAMIIVSSTLAIVSVIFAPRKGWLFRQLRIAQFRRRCIEENSLKAMWKGQVPQGMWVLYRLRAQGYVGSDGLLTPDGRQKAASIVRLHRLWELYLAQKLNEPVDRVHKTAEEMEHILTPELERMLTEALLHPKKDPHKQPIPEGGYQP
jgi:manganese/zinc/iron transport system permease protein